jgi:hypothetical protein
MIHDDPVWFEDRMAVYFGEIYAPGSRYHDDFSKASPGDKATFLHEMTHVWQDQNYVDEDGAILQRDLDKNGGDYEKLYKYKFDSSKDLEDYNVEQQGNIVRDYYLATKNLGYPDQKFVTPDKYPKMLPFDDGPDTALPKLLIDELLAAPVAPDTRPDPLLVDILLNAPDADGRAPANNGSQTGPRIAPISEDGSSADTGSQREPHIGPINADGSPLGSQPPAPPAPPQAAVNNPGVSTRPPPPSPEQAETPPQLGPLPERPTPPPAAAEAPAKAEPEPDPAPRAKPLTEEDIDNNEQLKEDQRWLEENGNAQGGDNTSDPEDDEEGADSEMPNPMDDGPSYTNGDYIQLLTRNAPYVNPGPGGIDMAIVGDIDPSVLLTRNAPYVNPGPGDFDMPAGSSDYTVLLNRNVPYVNPGLFDIDLPVGDADPSVLLNRNGPRMTLDRADADLPGSASGGLLSDVDFGLDVDDLAGFEIG